MFRAPTWRLEGAPPARWSGSRRSAWRNDRSRRHTAWREPRPPKGPSSGPPQVPHPDTRLAAALSSSALVMHPPRRQPDLRQREREHDQEDDPRQRGRVAHLEILEGVVEEVE